MTSRSLHLIKETQVSVFISVQPHIPSCSCLSPSVSTCGWAQVRLLSSISALSSAGTQAAVPWVSLALSLLLSVVSYLDGEKCYLSHLPHAVNSQVQPLRAAFQSSFPALCVIQLYQNRNEGAHHVGFLLSLGKTPPIFLVAQGCVFSPTPLQRCCFTDLQSDQLDSPHSELLPLCGSLSALSSLRITRFP